MRETTHPSAYGCHLPYQGRLEQAFSEREGGPLAVDELKSGGIKPVAFALVLRVPTRKPLHIFTILLYSSYQSTGE